MQEITGSPPIPAERSTARPVLHRVRMANLILGLAAHSALTAVLILLVTAIWWKSFGGPPAGSEGARQEALTLLRGLRTNLRDHDAAQRMQMIFPEGSCFTWTLYGLAWANVAQSDSTDSAFRSEALAEIHRALDGQVDPASLDPFRDTQVRRGVFWLGQRNLLLGRMLELTPERERGNEEVTEFHRNSRELHDAFLASPTRHLDSYEGMCWPADNVTALASLGFHDEIYATDYRRAFVAWKDWTTSSPCPLTTLPAGHLYSTTGQHIEPARGCATSLMIPLLTRLDSEWTASLYEAYQKHFGITRLGFRMFREWPAGHPGRGADVDSGPIIWGAGITATGVGLAAARSQADLTTERDVRDLARMFGAASSLPDSDHPARWHYGGYLPVGDAFLAWGWSIPRGKSPETDLPLSQSRFAFHAVAGLAFAALVGQWLIGWKVNRRRLRQIRPKALSIP